MSGCGTCSLCCTLLAVKIDDELKPAGQTCHHCSKSGCGIYQARPVDCARFECAYLAGQRSINWRLSKRLSPMKSGLVLAFDHRGNLDVFAADESDWTRRAIRSLLDEVSGYLSVTIISGLSRVTLNRRPVPNERLSTDAVALLNHSRAIRSAAPVAAY